MLEGIEILSQIEIMKNPDWTSLFCFIVVVFIFLGLILTNGGLISDNKQLTICAACFTFGLFIAALIIIGLTQKEPSGRYEYKVLLDEDVSFTEIYEKYGVVGQEGLIWTLNDKEPKDD